ncbi:hypothetical protein [Photobacterium leiognathi]|uniref:hypothetical protein n=1 Tax=Photobacterium leiognathi TaxID=553611 RepID=UPI003DA08179
MKKMNSSYRLQIIKEVATRQRMKSTDDPMAMHISQLLENHKKDTPVKPKTTFDNSHYDNHAGGWVSNLWDEPK